MRVVRSLSLASALMALLSAPAAAQDGAGLGAPNDSGASATEPQVTGDDAETPPPPPGGDTAPAPPDVTSPGDATSPPEDEFEAPDAGEPERMRMLVVDAATFGIDPVVGRVTSAQMRETGADVGYQVQTQQETINAAQQLQMPYPPTPADLWRVSWVARVHRGAFARIWAHAGQYVIEVTVASLDGAGPFFARGTSGADDLREVVDRLLRTALPAPSVWNAEAGPDETSDGGTDGEAIDELDDLDSPAGGGGTSEGEPPEEEEPEPELRRWALTLQTEAVIGASSDFFYNHLVGVRLDFRITSTILLGAYVAYANLNARNDRAHNLLFMLQFENRIRISNDLDLTIPLRGAIGYLPFNGPVIRLAAGLNYAVSPDFEIGIDLLTPTFWILPDRTAVSLDIGIEGSVRF